MKFEVCGPFDVPLTGQMKQSPNEVLTKFFEHPNMSKYTKGNSALSEACGCYVFAISAKGGTLPWYVGKTGKTFRDECLTPNNIITFSKLLNVRGANQVSGGKPKLYLLPQVTPNGEKFSAGDASSIEFLETMLINMGVWRNEKLENISKTKKVRELEVAGFYKSKQRGRRSEDVEKLRAVFDLEKTLHRVFGL